MPCNVKEMERSKVCISSSKLLRYIQKLKMRFMLGTQVLTSEVLVFFLQKMTLFCTMLFSFMENK